MHITAGELSAEFEVPLIDDNVQESAESFRVVLSAPSPNAVLGPDADAVGTILDDDGPPLVSVAGPVRIREGETGTFVVSLSWPSLSPIVVPFGFANGTATLWDGVATSGYDYHHAVPGTDSVTIPAGATSGLIPVRAVDDGIDEDFEERFWVVLGTVTGGIVTVGTAEGIIEDIDDPPWLTVRATNPTVEEGELAEFVLTLVDEDGQSTPSGRDISVEVSTRDIRVGDDAATGGDDYVAIDPARPVLFSSGETVKRVWVATIDDTLDELLHERFQFVVSASDPTTVQLVDPVVVQWIADNDDPPEVTVRATSDPATVNEGERAWFVVELSAESGLDVAVQVYTVDGSAVAGTVGTPGDYVALNQTVTIDAGHRSETVPVDTTDDALGEDDETFSVELSQPPAGFEFNAVLGDPSTAEVTILDDDLAVEVADAAAREGEPVEFTVSLENGALAPPGGASVIVSTRDLSTGSNLAAAGEDYTARAGDAATDTVTILEGRNATTFTVDTTGDDAIEGDETFQVVLHMVDVSIKGTRAAGTIVNDDTVITITDAEATEGEAVTFTVTATPALSDALGDTLDVTVRYSTETSTGDDAATPEPLPDADYTPSPANATVTIDPVTIDAANPAAATATFTVDTLPDTLDENNETFLAHLNNATIGQLAADPTATGTILDDPNDEAPLLNINDPPAVTEGGTITFTITLERPSGRAIAITATTQRLYADPDTAALPGEDYTHRPPTPLTIAAGDTTTTFTVDTLDDALDEVDYETFSVLLRPATSGDDAVRFARGGAVGVGTIADDDASPTLTVTADNAEVTEGDLAHFTITLSGATGREVTAQARTFDGTAAAGDDYRYTSRQIQFPPGDSDSDRTFTVSVRTTDDPDGEADETFRLALVGTQNADSSLPATVTIIDDDVALSINNPDPAVEGDPLRFLVTLNTSFTNQITVDWATQDITDQATGGVDYTAANGTLTFEPGNEFQFITVETFTDTDPEPDEKLHVLLTNAQDSDNTLIGITDRVGTGTILDGGPRRLTITGNTAIEGQPLTFTLALDKRRNQPTLLVVRDDTGDSNAYLGAPLASPADYTLTGPGSYTIPATHRSVTFTVPTVDDDLDEDTERLLLRVDASAGIFNDGTPGVGLIDDNDLPPTLSVTGPGTVPEGDDATFTLELSGPSGRRVSAYVSTAPGTAGAPDDYSHRELRIDFQPGVERRVITVATVEDAIVESDETFTLRLTAPQDVTLATDTALTTIRDDDTGLSIADAEAVEGEPLRFFVTLGSPRATQFLVTLRTVDGTGDGVATRGDDYTGEYHATYFNSNRTQVVVEVPTLDDTVIEGYETLEVVLTTTEPGITVQDPTATGTILDADTVPVLTIARVEVEEGDTAEIVLELDRPSTEPISFRLWTWDVSGRDRATRYHDYNDVRRGIVFPPGETRAVMYVATVNDVLDERDETFGLALTTIRGAPQFSRAGRWRDAVTIRDNDPPPIVSVEGPGEVVEGETAAFTLRLSEPSGTETSISAETVAETATAPTDFIQQVRRIVFRQVRFSPGEVEAVVLVPTVEDAVAEPAERFGLRLYGPDRLTMGASSTAQVTILDDDVVVSVQDASALEGDSLRFDVVLSERRREDVTVRWQAQAMSATDAASGTDFDADASGTVTIPAGEELGFFTVDSSHDQDIEGDERFEVRLSGAVGAPLDDVIGIGTIVDDDTTVSVQGASASEGAPVRFVVRLSNPLSRGFSVAYTTEDLPAPGAATAGDDYEATSGQASFFAGATEVEVAVPTFSDDEDEAEERFGLRLTSTGMGSLVADPTAEGIIVNQTLPLLSLDGGSAMVDEGGAAPFTLRLSAASSEEVAVRVSTATHPGSLAATPGDDFEELSEFPVTIPAGQTEVEFSVQTIDDNADEFDIEYYWVSLLPLDADAAAVLGDRRARGSIADNDDAPTLTVTAAPDEVVEGATVTFTLRLSKASQRPIDVSYATAGHAEGTTVWAATPTRLACAVVPADARGDFEHASGTVTFVPGDPLQATIEVNTCDDMTTEGDGMPARGGIVEAFTLNARLTDFVGLGAADAATVQILDNDPLPVLRVGNADADEGDDLVFTLELSHPSELETQVLEWAAGNALPILASYINSLSLPSGELARAHPADYELVNRPVVFSFPTTTAEFRMHTNRDTDLEDADMEVFTLSWRSMRNIDDVNSSWTDPNVPRGLGTIRDRPTTTINILASGQRPIEGEQALITVVLSERLSHDLTLTYWTSEDPLMPQHGVYFHGGVQRVYNFVSAQPGLDFADIPHSVGAEVTIVAGAEEIVIPISTFPDEELELPERFIVGIDLPPDVTDVVPSSSGSLRARVLIIDNEWRQVTTTLVGGTLAAGSIVALAEGDSLTVRLELSWYVTNLLRVVPPSVIPSISAAAPNDLTLEITSLGPSNYPRYMSATNRGADEAIAGTDFTLPASVSISAGSTEASFVIQAIDDSDREGIECFYLDLSPGAGIPTDASGFPYGYGAYGQYPSTSLICIEDDD